MQPLIDGDVLRYEIGFAGEAGWRHNHPNSEDPPPFDYVAEVFDKRVEHICNTVEATAPPVLFLTGKNNFREQIATKKPYKGTRKEAKPFHYQNLTAYIKGRYDWRIQDGLEADDLMAIWQTKEPSSTIVCTRDKDLLQVPGWHYSWELGAQPSFGPELVDELGYLKLSSSNKLSGVGGLFFYAQCLIGDPVDNIPGLPKCGPVKAFDILRHTNTLPEAFKAVREAYRGLYGDSGDSELLEQARLLWMVRELDEEGKPVLWEFPNERN